MTTLVLNADAMPVTTVPLSTIHWQDAIRIIYLERAVVMEEYDYWVVRSPSVQIRMPSVIMLKEYQQHNGKVEFSRYNIILRDNYTCQYCAQQFPYEELTFDHVVPRRNGGRTTWENIVTSCGRCNQEKAHFDKMKPLTKPKRPTYWELAINRKKRPITVPHDSWINYLGWESDIIVDEKLTIKNINNDQLDSELPYLKI